MQRILFITQNLERTGSEMLLWYILRNLNKKKYESFLFVKEKGVLVDQLPSHVKYGVSYRRSKSVFIKAFRGMLKVFRINPLEYQLRQIQKKTKADIWYVNTIVIPEVYEVAKRLGVKIITHFHELPMAYNFIKFNDLKKIVEYSNGFIGCSNTVCDKIVDMGGSNVKRLYGFIDTDKITVSKQKSIVKSELGFDSNDFVWTISSNTSIIKGIDFLMPLLDLLPNEHKILWIGREDNSGTYYYVKKALEIKHKDRVKFIGVQEAEYYNYLNCSDAFLLLSREDSYPLVMLEAAFLGKTIVGFNSGGIKEFVEEEMGIVIDTWNFSDLVNAMTYVKNNPEKFSAEKLKKSGLRHEVNRNILEFEKVLDEL